MCKYIEHEIDWFMVSTFSAEETGLNYAIHITIDDGINEPYVLYTQTYQNDSTFSHIISFEGVLLYGEQFDELESVKKWINVNREILDLYWNGEIGTYEFIEKMRIPLRNS